MPLPPSLPDLRSLDLLISVVELGSLAAAARAHGIAQPSASSRIRNLERLLGTSVLLRSASGSQPTPEGLVLVEWSRRLVREAHHLNRAVEAIQSGKTGRLRVAASYTIAEFVLPGWLSRFHERHPQDGVALAVVNSDTVVQQLDRGDADIGFVESPNRPPGFHEQVVGHDRLIIVVAPEHPWAARRTVRAEELASVPLVLREPGSGTRAALEHALQANGLDLPIVALELGSAAAVRSAVMAGGAPTVISRLAVEPELQARTLVAVEVAHLDLSRDLRAIWPESSPLTRLARDLLDTVIGGQSSAVRDMPTVPPEDGTSS